MTAEWRAGCLGIRGENKWPTLPLAAKAYETLKL